MSEYTFYFNDNQYKSDDNRKNDIYVIHFETSKAGCVKIIIHFLFIKFSCVVTSHLSIVLIQKKKYFLIFSNNNIILFFL